MSGDDIMQLLNEIDLNLTNRCNLKCKYCVFNSGGSSNDELTFDKIKDLINEAKQLGLKDLHFTGGEPTLRNDLEEIINYASLFNIKTRLITNGVLLDKNKLINLKNAGLQNIMFSLDGMAVTHDDLRGMKGAFDLTINAIKEAIDLGFFVRVNSVACKTNISDLYNLLSYLNGLKVNTYSIFMYSPAGRGEERKHLQVKPDEWLKFTEEITKLAQSCFMNVVVEKGYYYYNEPHLERSCLIGPGAGCKSLVKKNDYLIITPDGNVWPCVLMVNSEYSLGNVKENTLSYIINNKRNTNFYSSLSEPSGICTSCEKWEDCFGGCRGYAKLLTGIWNNTDPRCPKINNEDFSYFPVCPIMKKNIKTGKLGGSSEQAIDQ